MRLRTIFQNANFNYLCSRAVEVRLEQEKEAHARGALPCSGDTAKFTNGAYNLVVVLAFSDLTQWVCEDHVAPR